MRKASITVEAVLVVPLVLMVIFLLLSLTFFVHARSWYTFAAYESTMLAASEGRLSVEKGEAAAQSRMEWWISQIPLPAEPVTVQQEKQSGENDPEDTGSKTDLEPEVRTEAEKCRLIIKEI